jgi:translation initiation factor 3 subunit D
MPSILLANTIDSLGLDDEWGPETVASTTLDGIPYAPYSKGDRLGRMADWTQEGKDGRDGRGNRQFNRNYRGMQSKVLLQYRLSDPHF